MAKQRGAGAAPGLASMLDLNGDGNPLDDILKLAGKALRSPRRPRPTGEFRARWSGKVLECSPCAIARPASIQEADAFIKETGTKK